MLRITGVAACLVLSSCATFDGEYSGIPCDGDEIKQHYECVDGQRQWQSG